MAQRIKGQEVSVQIMAGGELEDTLTEVINFEVVTKMELLEQGYLGETTNRYDDIFNGCSFSMELHLSAQRWFTFQKKVEARARRLQPDLEFNIVGTFLFPNGDTPIITIPNVFFGEMPKNTGGRKEYVKVKIQGAASEEDVQES